MATTTLSSEAQIRYMIQWFEEWSELQRQDFLPILAEKIATNGVYVNGIINSMSSANCQDKPMNLFQCRVKLFNEWFINWTNEDRDKLIKKISETDEAFGKKLEDEITGNKQVVDAEASSALEEEEAAAARPADAVVVENGSHPAAENLEVENHEVIDDQIETPQVLIAESNIPIEITAE